MVVQRVFPKLGFGTKAETLERLRPYLQYGIVDELIKFNIHEWTKNPDVILHEIQNKFTCKTIIRSSARSEDCLTESNAGHFRSIANVDTNNQHELKDAIDNVFNAYPKDDRDHQCFVQEYFSPVDISGVIFTRDINTLAPYITINYDDTSGSTDSITSGKGVEPKTFVLFKGNCYELAESWQKQICKITFELERLFGYDALDIEFLIKDNIIHILQVRPIAKPLDTIPDTNLIQSTLMQIHQRMHDLNRPHPDLFGKETLYGVMPDWNPAEMIGIKPRPLALSLYRELITDNVWAYQRDNYGYKRLRSFPLMLSFAGHPYIDIRVDFNSYLPKKMPENLSQKLIEYYLNKLKNQPESHDKIEFDIVLTCYTLDIENKIDELKKNQFTQEEYENIKNCLHDITAGIIGSPQKKGLYEDDLERIDMLENRRKQLLESSQTELNKIYWLVEDCKRYGTLPFAGIARAGFVAMLLLNSLVNLGIFSPQDKTKFLNSLNTVAKQLSKDTNKLKKGIISKENFINKYGHLRPGTYNILLGTYKDQFEKYFETIETKKETADCLHEESEIFHLTKDQYIAIEEQLRQHGFAFKPDHLMQFFKKAIEGREYAKFAFTNNVSEILAHIKTFGANYGFTADDLSFTEIGSWMKFYSTVAHLDEIKLLEKEIEHNRRTYLYYSFLKLPHLITRPEDLFAFNVNTIEPNYISDQEAEGDVICITERTNHDLIAGKIICIETADPGFDWIFSHGISGLITMYGGANSHMAIRSAEMNIPSVIGCGPVLFEHWSRCKRLKIDCACHQVTIIS